MSRHRFNSIQQFDKDPQFPGYRAAQTPGVVLGTYLPKAHPVGWTDSTLLLKSELPGTGVYFRNCLK